MEQKVMNKEFKKIKSKKETRYVLEAASGGATSSAAVATGPVGKKGNLLVQGKDDQPVVQRRNPVAANVNAAVGGGGSGAHKDRKKAVKRGEFKHKKDFRRDVDENKEGVVEGWKGAVTGGALGAAVTRSPTGARIGAIVGNKVGDWVSKDKKQNENQTGAMLDPELALPQARRITKAIKYDNTVNEILGEIEQLAERTSGLDKRTLKYSITSVYEANNALESAVFGLEEAFEDAAREAQYKRDEEEVDEGYGMGGYATVAGSEPVAKHVPEDNVDPGYIDQENGMTSSDLKALYQQAMKLRSLIKKMGDDTTLEPWQQTKIAKASDYVNSVFRSLDDEYGLDNLEEKIKGADGKACWKGYRYAGTEKGKDKCVKVGEDSVNEAVKKSETFMVMNPYFDINDESSPEEIKVRVDYQISGKYWKGDFDSPPEYPEVDILSVRDPITGMVLDDPKIEDNARKHIEDVIEQDAFQGYQEDQNKKGLWANIHARRKKGLPPRKPGQAGAPTKKSWDSAVAASKKKKAVGEDNLEEYETHTYVDSQGRKWRVNDEGDKELLYDPNNRYSSSRSSSSKTPEVYYFYNIPDGSAMKASSLGLKRTKSGKWYAKAPIDAATAEFGPPKKWMPKAEEAMMPASHFAGTPKNKLGPAAQLKGKMNRPARQGDLVGSAEESVSKKKILKKN